jgi:Ca-activated chloride channel family protein
MSPRTSSAHRRAMLPLVLVLAPLLTAGAPPAPTRYGTTTVVGRVTDASGHPIPQAIVSIRARSLETRTAIDGRYSLPVPGIAARGEPQRLAVRRIGYLSKEVAVFLQGDTVRLDVQLEVASTIGTISRTDTSASSAAGARRTTSQDRAPVTTSVGASLNVPGAIEPRPDRRAIRGIVAETRAAPPSPTGPDGRLRRAPWDSANTEAYDHIDENAFRSPRVAPLSTFSVDVDRASYSNVRRFLTRGTLPPRDAVRLEELVNYFPYDDPAPTGEVPIRISTELAAAPWNQNHDLLRIALRARDVDMRRAPPSNLVFLIDVSGSMNRPERLPLVKQSLALLVNELREEDRVAIVVYAGRAGLVLPSTSGEDKQRILAALDGLEAGGSTAGGAGLRLAYDVAREHFLREGNNRVILCTDGDFNVGQSSDAELVRLIEERRREGSYLTILGFGMGNYKDAKMEKLAGAGNGNYGYVDDLLEARKMLVREMGGTLLTVAKDVKLQVEFNPAQVQAYRLLGYEDRLLRDEDFTNDARDAGDVGAGHTVTALYEIVRAGAELDVPLPGVAPLRYQRAAPRSGDRDELLHVAMRYKAPDGERSMLVTQPVGTARTRRPSESMRFASAVAGFGMLLRHSPNAGALAWPDVLALARGARGRDEDGYRADFIRLAEIAAQLDPRVATMAEVRPW